MTQLDPSAQIRLGAATLNLLGGPRVRLRNEDHAKKFIESFRYLYCGLSAGVAKGEMHADGEPAECFHKLPQLRKAD